VTTVHNMSPCYLVSAIISFIPSSCLVHKSLGTKLYYRIHIRSLVEPPIWQQMTITMYSHAILKQLVYWSSTVSQSSQQLWQQLLVCGGATAVVWSRSTFQFASFLAPVTCPAFHCLQPKQKS